MEGTLQHVEGSGYHVQPDLSQTQYSSNNWDGFHEYSQDLVQGCGISIQGYSENSGDYTHPSKEYQDISFDYGKIAAAGYMEQSGGQEYDNQGYYTSYYPDGFAQGEYTYQDYQTTQEEQYQTGWDMDPLLAVSQRGAYSADTSTDTQQIDLNSDNASVDPGSTELSSPSEQDLDLFDLEEKVETQENVMIRDKARNNFKKFRGGTVRKVYQRQAANVRERRRMRTINEAFENLRLNVPQASDDKKTSKVDTLRLAIQYIGDLTQVLQSCGDITLPGLRTGRGNNKIIVSYTIPDVDPDSGEILSGHSLSWHDNKSPKITEDNKLYAPLWIPLIPTADDIKAIEGE